MFRKIVLANFKFKIISKVFDDILATLIPFIHSKEQRGFFQGRNIKDCICLASEAINLLDMKSIGGNLAIKVDIIKAFDTLDWSFLLKVLAKFGFNPKFCYRISTILNSAHLSVTINGTTQGFFKCNRGVRQGDPLSLSLSHFVWLKMSLVEVFPCLYMIESLILWLGKMSQSPFSHLVC